MATVPDGVTAVSLFASGGTYSEPEVTAVRVTWAQAKKVHKKLRLNPEAVSYATLLQAMTVELEHGSLYGPIGNVTHDNLVTTARVALVHIMEYRDYYDRLATMEAEAKAYWDARAQSVDFSLPPLFVHDP